MRQYTQKQKKKRLYLAEISKLDPAWKERILRGYYAVSPTQALKELSEFFPKSTYTIMISKFRILVK